MNFIKDVLGGLGAVAAFLVMLAIQIGVFVFTIWAVATLWQHFTSEPSSSNATTQITDDTRYQQQFRQEFMEGCTGEDADREYCICIYDELESDLGFEKLHDLAEEYYYTEEIPPKMWDVTEYCMDRIDSTRFN